MQSDVEHILTTAEGISFEDRDGNPVTFDLVTARNFKESAAERILLVGPRRWEREQDISTGGRVYNGYWVYTVYIYVPAKPKNHEDYTDFDEVENAAAALLNELLPDSEWEFNDQDFYEGQLSSRELIAAEIEVKKFATRRFLG